MPVSTDFRILYIVSTALGADPTFTLTGSVSSPSGKYDSSGITTDHKLFTEYSVGGDKRSLEFDIISIDSVAANLVSITVTRNGSTPLAFFPTGTFSIVHKTVNQGLFLVETNEPPEQRSSKINDAFIKLDNLAAGGSDVNLGKNNLTQTVGDAVRDYDMNGQELHIKNGTMHIDDAVNGHTQSKTGGGKVRIVFNELNQMEIWPEA